MSIRFKEADPRIQVELSQFVAEWKKFRREYGLTGRCVSIYFDQHYGTNYTVNNYSSWLANFLRLYHFNYPVEQLLQFKDRLSRFMNERRKAGVNPSRPVLTGPAHGFPAHQKQELLALFTIKRYPTVEERKELAERIGLKLTQVNGWFRGERRRCGHTQTAAAPLTIRHRLPSNNNLPVPIRKASSTAARRILKSCIKTKNRAVNNKRVRFSTDGLHKNKASLPNFDTQILSSPSSITSCLLSDDEEGVDDRQNLLSYSVGLASPLDTTMMEVDEEANENTDADNYVFNYTSMFDVKKANDRSALSALYAYSQSIEEAWHTAAPYNITPMAQSGAYSYDQTPPTTDYSHTSSITTTTSIYSTFEGIFQFMVDMDAV